MHIYSAILTELRKGKPAAQVAREMDIPIGLVRRALAFEKRTRVRSPPAQGTTCPPEGREAEIEALIQLIQLANEGLTSKERLEARRVRFRRWVRRQIDRNKLT